MNQKPVAAGKSSFDLVDRAKVFSMLSLKPGECFLDLACGLGYYSLEAAKRVGVAGKVYAADLWVEGLTVLRDEAAAQHLAQIEAIQVDMTRELPLQSHSLDSCLLATVLHDLSRDDQENVLRELARLLKTGGLLNIIEFKKISEGPGPDVAIRINPEDLKGRVTPFGFTLVSSAEVGDYNYLSQFRKNQGD